MMFLCHIIDERNFVEDIIFLQLSAIKDARFLQMKLPESVCVMHLRRYDRNDISQL